MTERSIFSGSTPQVIIRSGGDVTVKGYDSDHVLAGTNGNWGLQLKRKKHAIEVQIGGNGQVLVPFDSSINVYAGRSGEIQSIQGNISAVSGMDLSVVDSNILQHTSAGGIMSINCRMVAAQGLKLTAGWHLHSWLRELKNVRYQIDNLGGNWQAILGDVRTVLKLKAGGDISVISEAAATYQPEDGPYGKVERPA